MPLNQERRKTNCIGSLRDGQETWLTITMDYVCQFLLTNLCNSREQSQLIAEKNQDEPLAK